MVSNIINLLIIMNKTIIILLISLYTNSLYSQDQTKPFLLAKAFIMDIVYVSGESEELDITPTIWIDGDHAKFYYSNGDVYEYTFKSDRHELSREEGVLWSYQYISSDENICDFDVFLSTKYPEIRFITISNRNAPKIIFECEVVYQNDY